MSSVWWAALDSRFSSYGIPLVEEYVYFEPSDSLGGPGQVHLDYCKVTVVYYLKAVII